ncbi:MAG: TldD/PmbA family protein [Planctomycetota bacterium]|jgi:PmbA protein
MKTEELIERAASRSEAAEVFAASGSINNISFENSKLKSINRSDQFGYALRVVSDGRLGFSATTRAEDANNLLERALAVAEFGGPCEFKFSGALEGDAPELDIYDSTVPAISVAELVDEGKDCVARLKEIEPELEVFLSASFGEVETSLASSGGFSGTYKFTVFGGGIGGMLLEGTSKLILFEARSATGPSFTFRELIPSIEADLAIARKNVEISTGAYDVVLTPECVSNLLWSLGPCVNGKSVLKGESPLKDKLGERIFDERITIFDDPHLKKGVSSKPFDDEGTPTCRKPVFERGVLKNFLLDRNSAAGLKKEPNGNGIRGDFNAAPNPGATNLLWEGGDVSKDELISNVKDGLVVDRLMGVIMGNPYSGFVNGNIGLGFRVENGERTGRVKDAMFSTNIFQALKENLTGVSKERKQVGSHLLPWIAIGGVNIASANK